MKPNKNKSSAAKFLELMHSDEDLRKVLDQVLDESIITVATALAAERGLKFTSAELVSAIESKLSLGEYKLSDDGGAGKCKSDSGCRTPCVYCKSNRIPSLSEIAEKFGQR